MQQLSLKQQITEDMKTAMRAKDTARLGAIRLLLAAMKQREVDGMTRCAPATGAGMPPQRLLPQTAGSAITSDLASVVGSPSRMASSSISNVSEAYERIELSDTDVVAIIEKMNKQRRDSISQYEAAGRQDLADVEKFEMSVLAAYMPQQLNEAEITSAVLDAIAATGAASQQDMGKVMGMLKPKLAGRADMSKVSALIKAQLSK